MQEARLDMRELYSMSGNLVMSSPALCLFVPFRSILDVVF